MIIAAIPAHNEERSIAKVILRTRQKVDRVILVDDGSNDATGEIGEALGATVIRHTKNLGYGAYSKKGRLKWLEEATDQNKLLRMVGTAGVSISPIETKRILLMAAAVRLLTTLFLAFFLEYLVKMKKLEAESKKQDG